MREQMIAQLIDNIASEIRYDFDFHNVLTFPTKILPPL